MTDSLLVSGSERCSGPGLQPQSAWCAAAPSVGAAPLRRGAIHRASRRRRSALACSALLGALSAALLGLESPSALAQQAAEQAPLYTLQTNCSVRGVAERCQVEALDGKDATVYRTTIKGQRTSFRLLDSPGQRSAQIWNAEQRNWVALDKLSLDFEARTLCLNGDALCVENPNYFSSLRLDYPDLRSDLIVARFDHRSGALSAICYSREACNAGF